MGKSLPKVIIVGCGRMGSFLAKKLSESHELFVYDRNYMKAEALSQSCSASAIKKDELKKANIVILALDSDSIPEAIVELEDHLAPEAIIVNIATSFPHSKLISKFENVSAKIVGHAKELALGEKPVIIIEGDNLASREMVKKVFENIGNVIEGPTDLVSKINTISSRQGIIAALEIKKALSGMDLDDETIIAAIRIVAAGTMKAFAIGEAGPFVQKIIDEYQRENLPMK